MHVMYKAMMRKRFERQKVFFSSKEQGDILIYYKNFDIGLPPALESFFIEELSIRPIEEICNNKDIGKLTWDFLKTLRQSYKDFYEIDNDCLPTVEVYFGIGSVTSAMSGKKTRIISGITWCSPIVNWEDIETLKFDSQNIWVQFALKTYRILLEQWDEDFLFLPFLHRSPLDGANGLRGDDLFLDLYDHPEKAKWLINWCAEWSIKLENYISENVREPEGWGRGIWGTCLPRKAVVVNGDPVDMIKREFQPVFDRPYTEKLFVSLGGGFFHHHALGLHQVDQITSMRGILVQQMYDDPNTLSIAEVIISDKKTRDKILEASLKVPIQLDEFSPEFLDQLLPIIKEGRFILRPLIKDKKSAKEVVKKVRKFSNIK